MASPPKKHGYDYSTEILKECQSKEELKEWGIIYSILWDIVKSDDWANLKLEEGDGTTHSKEVREKIGKSSKGRKQSSEARKKNSEANSGANNPMFGKTHSEEARLKISESKKNRPGPNKGRKMSEDQKQKIRDSVKANYAQKSRLTPDF
jgi:hypothetical protein